jgi:hypothetical protein
MKLAIFDAICKALNTGNVRYLVAGGLAVNAHGYLRLTYDVDLVIQLDRENILAAFASLAKVGYRPTVPVTGVQFADARQRKDWIKNKHMQVLNFHNAKHQQMPVDVFVTEPFDFDLEYKAAKRGNLAPGLPIRFVSISTLIKMKKLANRPKDLDDIAHLRTIAKAKRRAR